jgi:hypothetical protein
LKGAQWSWLECSWLRKVHYFQCVCCNHSRKLWGHEATGNKRVDLPLFHRWHPKIRYCVMDWGYWCGRPTSIREVRQEMWVCSASPKIFSWQVSRNSSMALRWLDFGWKKIFRICKIKCHPQAWYSDSGESAITPGRSQIISSLEVERKHSMENEQPYLQSVSKSGSICCWKSRHQYITQTMA